MVLMGALAGCASGGGGSGGPLQAEFAQEIQPILTANCTGCHGPGAASGGVNLAFANLAGAQTQNAAFWTRVRTAITSGRMPPAQAPRRPSNAERDRLVEFISEHLAN